MSWVLRWLLGEWAKVVAALMAWNVGQPVDVYVQVNQIRLKIVAQQGGALPPGVRRRLVIDELKEPQ